jgi:hypothetical protein
MTGAPRACNGGRMTGLIAISYSSVATKALSGADLDALLLDAQAFNEGIGVSGALCYDEGVFIQYFEGPEEAVERVYARITASPLHTQVTEISRNAIDVRQFDGWYMASCRTPDSILQVLANIGWEANMPVTRTTTEPNPGLSLLLYHWNRWMAEKKDAAATGPRMLASP